MRLSGRERLLAVLNRQPPGGSRAGDRHRLTGTTMAPTFPNALPNRAPATSEMRLVSSKAEAAPILQA